MANAGFQLCLFHLSSHRRSCLPGSLSDRTSREDLQAGERASMDVAESADTSTTAASAARRRPPELGRSPCRALLGCRGLPGGEALLARGQVGLRGRTDACKTSGCRFSLWERRDASLCSVTTLFCAFHLNQLTSCRCGSQAADCTLVTTGSSLPKKAKDWLEMSRDQHRPIRKGQLRRRAVDMTRALDCVFDLVDQFLSVMKGRRIT